MPPPTVDMVNEVIETQATSQTKEVKETTIIMTTPNKQSVITLKAAPLPAEVVTLLENNIELIRMIDRCYYARSSLDEFSNLSIKEDEGKIENNLKKYKLTVFG